MPRPSFGCSNCRARRIKCDERPNGCLNCQLYGNLCPGYPDRFDVMHRQHTPANSQPLHRAPPLTSAPRGHDLVEESSNPQPPTGNMPVQIHQQPLYDPDMVALALYYSNNCIDGSTLHSLQHIQAQGNGCLFAAIKALSSIDSQRRWTVPNRSLMQSESYHAAIQQLNLALASPDEARADSTLLAVMIMSAIETKASTSATTAYWEAHTHGAATLLQMRGAEQVTSRLGSALFFQVSSQLMTSCMLAGRSVPHELHRLRQEAQRFLVNEANTTWRLHGAMLRFTDFLATWGDQIPDRELARMIVIEALDIYNELSSIFDNADPDWQFYRLPSNRYEDLLDYEHRYNTVLATQHWNSYRIAVISLCTIAWKIGDHYRGHLELPLDAQSFLDDAVVTLNQTALDTIAAIPQALTMIKSKTASASSTTSDPNICERGYTHHQRVFHEVESSSPALPHMHGCMLQWSVYFGVQSRFVEPRIRRCLWEILETAGRTTQTRQWQNLAEQLREEVQQLPV